MKYCHVSRSTVIKWIKSNRLRAYLHPDGQYRITMPALIDFLKAYNMPMPGELLSEAGAPNESMASFGITKHGDE